MKFTTAEIAESMKTRHTEHIIICIDETIKYLRLIEKEYQKGTREISGVEILSTWLQEGKIKPVLYFKIREAVENPETPYIITEK